MRDTDILVPLIPIIVSVKSFKGILGATRGSMRHFAALRENQSGGLTG